MKSEGSRKITPPTLFGRRTLSSAASGRYPLLLMVFFIAILVFAVVATLVIKFGPEGGGALKNAARRRRTLDDKMKELGDQARALARKEYKLELTHDRASIRDLENRILEDLHHNQLITAYPEEELMEISQLWGAYVGEVLRRIRPGRWQPKSRHEGRRPMPFVLNRNTEVFPCSWVYRRIKHGADHCVHYRACEFADNRDNPRYALKGGE